MNETLPMNTLETDIEISADGSVKLLSPLQRFRVPGKLVVSAKRRFPVPGKLVVSAKRRFPVPGKLATAARWT